MLVSRPKWILNPERDLPNHLRLEAASIYVTEPSWIATADQQSEY